MKKLANNKWFKILSTIIKTMIYILIISFIVVVCLQRFSNNKISFFNYRMFTVVSGSMKPKYDIGDVLIAKEIEPSKIKVGDTISYLGNTGSFKGKVITHQVIKIEKDENNKLLFHAKGLANLVEDPIVTESQLFGIVKYKSRILTFVYGIVNTNVGFYLLIIIPVFYLITSEIISTLLEKEEKRRSQV